MIPLSISRRICRHSSKNLPSTAFSSLCHSVRPCVSQNLIGFLFSTLYKYVIIFVTWCIFSQDLFFNHNCLSKGSLSFTFHYSFMPNSPFLCSNFEFLSCFTGSAVLKVLQVSWGPGDPFKRFMRSKLFIIVLRLLFSLLIDTFTDGAKAKVSIPAV